MENKPSIFNLKLPEDLKKLSYSQCTNLCTEIRKILVSTVLKNGGHLSSNLGTVELTLAIHRVFDSPKDKIIWDVGHQSYTHKLLTGRYNRFGSIRTEGGISGFLRPSESEHDCFVSGHSSTSISAACGFAKGMSLKGDNHHAIAVIGDGAFTGGMAYEGLNNAGKSNENIIVILNHNNMSISKNVGALAKYLTSIRSNKKYLDAKHNVEGVLNKTPVVGKPIKKIIKSSKSVLKWALYHSTMFEDLGFVYLGPVDGHNLVELEETLSAAKSLNKPVFIHVNTIKGKGYRPAENNPGAFHGISPIEKCSNPEIISSDSFSAVFGNELLSLADKDSYICAITAAMKYGTGLQFFADKYPERFFDVGIAEQHAVTFAGGLACEGMLPVVCIYSTFLQRAYDQIIHDLAIAKLHVVLCVDRAGIVGEDGETHQGIFDIPMLTSVPGITIFSPSTYSELKCCLSEALYKTDGVVAVRYPRGNENCNIKSNKTDYLYINNKSNILIVSYGRVANSLLSDNKRADVIKLIKVFPISDEIIGICKNYSEIVFVEEGYKFGSISEHLSFELQKKRFKGKISAFEIDDFVPQSTTESALKKYNLDYNSIMKYIDNI